MNNLDGYCKKSLLYTFIFLSFFFGGCANNQAKPIALNNKMAVDTPVVIRVSPGTPIVYDSTKRYIYITLDDGPQNGTMNCFHVLSRLNAKASFFMIGTQVDTEKQRRKLDSIRNSYPLFLLANHSYTHANYNHYKAFYSNTDSAVRDINKAQSSMKVPLKIMRTPGNNSWGINGRVRAPALTKKLTHALDSIGYKVVGWDVEWHFKNAGGCRPVENTENMVRQVEAMFNSKNVFVHNHVVLLAHDRMFQKDQYADSLSKFIETLQKDPRNVFETIDHYPGIQNNK